MGKYLLRPARGREVLLQFNFNTLPEMLPVMLPEMILVMLPEMLLVMLPEMLPEYKENCRTDTYVQYGSFHLI